MKVRSDILISRKAVLLGGVMLVAMFPAASALAQNANGSDWYSNGSIEAGSNFFIQKPGNGFGKSSTDPFWLTPNTTDSSAKMDEYGKVPRGLFLNELAINAGTKDGRFALDLWADNVGMNNQRYQFNLYEPGRQYLTLGWDEVPHVLGTSAKSIFGGVGTARLTVDSRTRTTLQANLGPATQTQAQRNAIESYIDNTAPMSNITLETKREKFTAAYRNTMFDAWDFNVDYSHEQRTGTRPLGIGYGYSQTTAAGVAAAPRPSSGAIEVPQPLDDRTQNANAIGEYVGTTPWGTRWNTSVQYMGSFYGNSIKSIDVDNPFCITCVAAGSSVASGTQIGPNLLRYGLYPDNSANGATWNTSVELPWLKTRYTSNVQYMMFRQNDGYINDATNGIAVGPTATQLNPYPASSLNGSVNAFLTNNVLYSHLTHDVTNTLRVRLYDRQDNTPTQAFSNYVYADNGTATTTPLTRMPQSNSRLNVSDTVKWQANRAWAFGAEPFFERMVYQNGEVDSTNEGGAKAFVNWTPWSFATARSSVQYSQRRYNTYLAIDSTDAAAQAMRYFFVANRDRTKWDTIVELQVFKDVTLSPNGGLRWDNYPADKWFNAGNQASSTLGTRYDRSWNAGADLGVRVTPELKLTLGYNHEEHYLALQTCCGGATPYNDSNKWSSDITQKYNTYMASADWKAIPGKLDFRWEYLAALANEANNTTACTSGATNCTGLNTGQTSSALGFPDERNRFQRFSFITKYYVDPGIVKQMGWFGTVTAKLRYTWERNANTNYATDNFSPYSPSAADAGGNDITNGGRSLFLAYNNPNYTAQIIMASLGWKW
jgi:MtrB/PioB family decaheme-associated outer membrane protein